MADNYVSIKIRASDTAKPDLTDLKAQLDELGAKVETAKVNVDDRDAGAKLLDLNAKLADLNRKVASPRITVAQAARAEAQIAALSIELDKLGEKTAKPSVELKGAAKTTAEIAALDAELNHLDDKAARAGPGGLLSRIIGGAGGAIPSGGIGGALLGPAGLAIVPALGALLTEVTGLVSGFAAAGAGAGAFALLAKPAITQVQTAYQGLNAAQQKYQDAQAKYAEAPTKANAKAMAAAALNLDLMKDKVGKLPAAAQGAVGGLQGLSAEFGKLSRAFAPEAFKVFNDLLKIANNLLPVITPFATAFANALDGLLRQAGKFTQSNGFKDWLAQFQQLSGPAVTAIGQGIGKVAIEIGKLLTVMSKKDVVNAINIAFTVLADTIGAITYAVRRFMENWSGMTSTAARDSRQVATAFDSLRHDISAAFDSIRHTFASAGHDIAHNFDDMRHAAATWFHELASIFDSARHTVASWADGVGRAATTVVSWFRALPGRILGALGNLGSLLVHAGEAIIDGLIRGIESKISALGHLVSGIGHFIAGLKGPIPADLLLLVPHGQAIMQGLMNGMASRLPDLRGQLAGISGTISGAQFSQVPGWGQLAGGHGGTVQLEVAAGGASEFEQFMLMAVRKWVRVKGGGDVQKAFGT